VSSDAAPAASFSPLFGKTLRHQLLTYPASAQTTIWCKKRVSYLLCDLFQREQALTAGHAKFDRADSPDTECLSL
jgi:hypothetical protein